MSFFLTPQGPASGICATCHYRGPSRDLGRCTNIWALAALEDLASLGFPGDLDLLLMMDVTAVTYLGSKFNDAVMTVPAYHAPGG